MPHENRWLSWRDWARVKKAPLNAASVSPRGDDTEPEDTRTKSLATSLDGIDGAHTMTDRYFLALPGQTSRRLSLGLPNGLNLSYADSTNESRKPHSMLVSTGEVYGSTCRLREQDALPGPSCDVWKFPIKFAAVIEFLNESERCSC